MKREAILILSTCLLILSFASLAETNQVEVSVEASNIRLVRTVSATIVVPDDFLTIQEAIDNAVDGDTIFVKNGTYYEHVVVNKTVSLTGEDVGTTIIDGNNSGHVVHIVSDYVNVTGFTVQNSGNTHMPNLDAGICLNATVGCRISGNRLVNNGFAGISLLSSQRNTITDNNVTGTGWGGIHLMGSSNNTVSGNKIAEKYGGINGHVSSNYNNITENCISNSTYGMFYHASNHNNICGNNISAIATEGIWLQEQVNYNVVAENTLINNTVAIRLQGPNRGNILLGNVIVGATHAIRGQYSTYNTIHLNNISRNGYGFYLDYCQANTIWGNNIADNDQQAYVSTDYANTWDNGYPTGGNYWSNYTGVDSNRDGIGDSNHTINGSNVDKYPLMGTFSSFKTPVGKKVDVVSNSTVDGFQCEPSGTIHLHISNKTASQTYGFCRASIPYEVLSEPFNVTIDGASPAYWNYSLYDNGTHRWIYFEYEYSTGEVVIVPEFPLFATLPLFMILMSLAASVAMRKHIHQRWKLWSRRIHNVVWEHVLPQQLHRQLC